MASFGIGPTFFVLLCFVFCSPTKRHPILFAYGFCQVYSLVLSLHYVVLYFMTMSSGNDNIGAISSSYWEKSGPILGTNKY